MHSLGKRGDHFGQNRVSELQQTADDPNKVNNNGGNTYRGQSMRRLNITFFFFFFVGTVVLEKTLEGPLDFKEIQQVHPKGNQF